VPVPEEDDDDTQPPPAPKPKSQTPYYGIVDFPPAPYTQALNVRSGPGTNYPVVVVLPEGARVVVIELKGSWGRLKSGGWASTSYIRKI